MLKKNIMGDPDLKVTVSPFPSHGVASRDPMILCRELPNLENESLDCFTPGLTYDTFQALGNPRSENSYTFSWPGTVTLNTLILTMGFPFADGGWWTELVLEYRRHRKDPWNPVPSCEFSPPYNTMDTPFGRFPFEEFKVTFPAIQAAELRLRGTGGGYSSFTSLAGLRAGMAEPGARSGGRSRNYPMPGLFSLISADKIWQLGNFLYKATGLYLLTAQIQYYLTAEARREFHRIYNLQYTTPPVWRILNDKDQWKHYSEVAEEDRIVTKQYFGGIFAQIQGPILFDGINLGSIMTYPPVLMEDTPPEAHKHLAEEYGVDWQSYLKAMDNTVRMSRERIDGIAGLIGFIMHEILHQVQHARILNRKEGEIRPSRENLIQDALALMEQDLENGIQIDSLLEKLRVSYHQLAGAFKELHGSTPHRVLHELKMERAQKYLKDGRLRIIDIAGTLGYTENHFIRSFKSRNGMTPGEYRKSIRSDP